MRDRLIPARMRCACRVYVRAAANGTIQRHDQRRPGDPGDERRQGNQASLAVRVSSPLRWSRLPRLAPPPRLPHLAFCAMAGAGSLPIIVVMLSTVGIIVGGVWVYSGGAQGVLGRYSGGARAVLGRCLREDSGGVGGRCSNDAQAVPMCAEA